MPASRWSSRRATDESFLIVPKIRMSQVGLRPLPAGWRRASSADLQAW
ncbi:hypothetical protein BIW11_11053 [Tropilaelaps mercedesae]|uniref:Uncharacterized protein n=1 Tax=Tropilaelaps mercedesae TaxID=418985 RepID=A0A1V9XCR1_9ACAR|nr:hypothetical protein BIW11_11053 [Tropilaelaps mercedesae]